jgi:hypothetical protein
MAFKPNYNQLRNDRNRAKEAKKNEKKRALEEETAKRKSSSETSGEDALAEPAVAE